MTDPSGTAPSTVMSDAAHSEIRPASRGLVVHLDIDYFFAQAEELRRPELVGQPVAVGGLGPRGVVATANYVARRHGVHSALAVTEAMRRCPRLVVLPADFEWYRALSLEVTAACAEWPGPLERVGMDELYLQLADTSTVDPADLAGQLRASVKARTGLTASVGVAPTPMVAKLASESAKPNGDRYVPAGEIEEFLAGHRLAQLPGVGPVSAERLARFGLIDVPDARRAGIGTLVDLLGQTHGVSLWEKVTAGGSAELTLRGDPASIGCERTAPHDIIDAAELDRVAGEVAGEAHRRLVRSGLGATTVTVKVRSGRFEDMSRARRLGPPGLYQQEAAEAVLELARELWARCEYRIRLLGVTYSGLEEDVQMSLFGGTATPADPLPRPGDQVAHATFGAGEVVYADDRSAVVRFADRVHVLEDPRRHLRRTADQ